MRSGNYNCRETKYKDETTCMNDNRRMICLNRKTVVLHTAADAFILPNSIDFRSFIETKESFSQNLTKINPTASEKKSEFGNPLASLVSDISKTVLFNCVAILLYSMRLRS